MKSKIFAGSETTAVFVMAFSLPVFLALVFFVFPGLAIIGQEKLQIALVGYCVVLLSFFAGTRYGALLNGIEAQTGWLVPFALGPVLAIAILLMPFSLALAVLIAGFGGHGAWDSWAAFKGKLPKDYSTRRILLTATICLMLITILIVSGLQ
ncbi:MAG: DUF3429 domain-containing protein [Devosiaceae bacterium]|nr:DUF3429 domain-containing protein [Devosiaceae bacterium]